MRPGIKNPSRPQWSLQAEDFLEGLPIIGALQVADFVAKVNGTRVQRKPQYDSAINDANDKDSVSLSIIRVGKPITVKIKAIDGRADLERTTSKIISGACSLPEVKDRPACLTKMPASSK